MECDNKWRACGKLLGNILDIASQSGADLYRGCLHPPTEMGWGGIRRVEKVSVGRHPERDDAGRDCRGEF